MTDDRTPCITLPLAWVERMLKRASPEIPADYSILAAIQAEVDQVKGLAQEHLKC